MNKQKRIECLEEFVDSNQEALKRLMFIIAAALPHTDNEIAELYTEWAKIGHEINKDFNEK